MLEQVRFAIGHTRFYPSYYREHGIELGDISSPEVIGQLPIVTKELVRARADEFRSDEATAKTSIPVATGGSTGEPLRMWRDARLSPRAYEWRLLSWWGLPPHVNTAIVYRFFRSRRGTLGQKILWWPSKRFQLDAFDMTPSRMTAFLDTYRRVRPELVLGYVGGILELARFIETHEISLPGSPVIATTAAPISLSQRQEIESAFGGTVYDHYRCAELNWVAGECATRDGLHVFEDLKRLEIVDSDHRPVREGEPGRVVVSDFTNRVFPLIRYQLGDVTSFLAGPCACGMPYRRIRSIEGRVSDALNLPDGKVIAGESLTGTFSRVAEAVKQFQIVQQADWSIVIKVVPQGDPSDPRIADALLPVRNSVGGAVPISLEIVDSIPHVGGKTAFIVNNTTANRAQG